MTRNLTGELEAMAELEAVLKELSDEERGRVLQWASARFKAPLKGASLRIDEVSGGVPEEHADLVTFYDAASPKTDPEKALVVAYWLQYREGQTEIKAQAVNTRLKDLGHGIGNIRRAFEALKDEKPTLMMQTKKEGKTQQARKKFKVTAEGKKKVEGMLAAQTPNA